MTLPLRAPRAALAALAAAWACAPGPAGALTLKEAIAEALRSNPSVTAAREGARALHEGVPQALAAWQPRVQAEGSGGVSYAYTPAPDSTALPAPDLPSDCKAGPAFVTCVGSALQRLSPPPPDPWVDAGRWSLALSYTQNLYRGSGRQADLRRAAASVHEGHAQVEETEQYISLRVVETYLDVLRALRTVEVRESSLASFDARISDAEAQFRVGDRTRADVAQATAERELAVSDVASAKADLEVLRALFETLVGLPPDDLEPVAEPPPLPDSLEAAREGALADNPAVRRAAHALAAANEAVRSVESEVSPRVDLSGGANHGGDAFSDARDSTTLRVDLQVTVPLYRGGDVSARLRRAKRVEAQLRARLEDARRDAARGAAEAWRRLDAARQNLTALEAAVEATRTALDGLQREAEIGERTTREVLDAERNLVQQQIRVLFVERNATVEAYRLLSAVGALTARRQRVAGVPDLYREARETAGRTAPVWMPSLLD